MKTFDWVYKLLRWGLGCVFVYAGAIKLADPETFAVLIDAYGIVPQRLLMPAAVALPALEAAAGIGLIFDIKGSLAAIAGLMGVFIAVLSYGILMGLDVDCGCFGRDDPEAEAFHGLRSSLYRDLAMLAGVFFLCGWRRYRAIKPAGALPFIKKIFNKPRRIEDAHT